MPRARNQTPGLRLRVVLEREIAMGPGKAQLLEGIRDTGSIAAAGRALGMSYKRAWQLVETMNACFRSPLVEAAKGGREGGGAHLTDLGREVLSRYRRMEAAASAAAEAEMEALRDLLSDMSERK